MTHLKQIGLGHQLYKVDHNGKNPPELASLTPYLGKDFSEMISCPATKGSTENTLYIYRGNDVGESASASVILVYEKSGNHPKRRNALFGDGHVESLTEAEFQKAIEKDNKIRRDNKLEEKSVE